MSISNPFKMDIYHIICAVCQDNQVETVYTECGHIVCCEDCAAKTNECPICRKVSKCIRFIISANGVVKDDNSSLGILTESQKKTLGSLANKAVVEQTNKIFKDFDKKVRKAVIKAANKGGRECSLKIANNFRQSVAYKNAIKDIIKKYGSEEVTISNSGSNYNNTLKITW